MAATLTVQEHRSHRWIAAVLLVSAIVATVVIALTVFAGRNDAPATPAPAPVVHTPGPGVDTGCVHTGPAMKAC